MKLSIRLSIVLMCAGLAALTLVACGGRQEVDHPESRGSGASTWMELPYQTLRDWVSYGHQVSVVTVVGEQQHDVASRVRERGEGFVGRDVTLRVDETLWVASTADELEGELRLTGWGYWYKEGDLHPFQGRLEVGERYLVPLADFGDDGWGSMTPSAIPVSEDGAIEATGDNALQRLVGDKTVDELAGELAATEPYELAEEHSDLAPLERHDAIQTATAEAYRTEEAAQTPTP